MSKNRNIADLLDANGDVKSANLDNVPPSNDASALTTGTLPIARISDGSVTEAKIADAAITSLKSGRKNLIINGGFDVWQRGTSNTASAGSRYLADRWCLVSGTGTASSSRQEFAQGQTDVPNNPKYYHRVTVATSGNYTHFDNRIEDVTRSNGETMTLSFWAKASSNMLLGLELVQTFGGTPEINGGERNIFGVGEGFSVTTAWQKFTLTHTFSSFSGETLTDANRFTVRFAMDSDSGMQARWGGQVFTGDVDIANVQLELGDTATDFEHRSYGEELALCQRYFERGEKAWTNLATSNYNGCYVGFNASKRTNPTMTIKSFSTGTAGKIYHQDAATDVNARTYVNDPTGCYIGVSNTSTGSGSNMKFIMEAEAEL